MNVIIKSEKIQELEVIVDEHYNKEGTSNLYKKVW